MGRNVRYVGPIEGLGRLIGTRLGKIAIAVFAVLVLLVMCSLLFVSKPKTGAATVTPTSYLIGSTTGTGLLA
jgi:hypothetical protein